jgi:hypothetical protein
MCDFGGFQTFSSPVARKDHRCVDCGRVIPKGVEHAKISYTDMGKMWDSRICNQCGILHQLMDLEFGGDDGCGIAWGELRETWFDHYNDLPVEVLALSPARWVAARRKI